MSNQTPAIVLAAFGASSERARHVYAHIDELVRRCKPKHEVSWAFTSRRVVEKLRKQDIRLPTLDQTMAGLRERGVRAAVVQPLLTVPGEEYGKIARTEMQGIQVGIGAPLLACAEDVRAAVDAMEPDLRSDAANVVVCHGNAKHPEYSKPLLKLAREFEARHPDVAVASLEGEPGAEPLQHARLLAQGRGAVHFVPFMMVAGEHLTEDVMGDAPGSWRRRIAARNTTCAPALGWNLAILLMFLRHLNAAMAEMERRIE